MWLLCVALRPPGARHGLCDRQAAAECRHRTPPHLTPPHPTSHPTPPRPTPPRPIPPHLIASSPTPTPTPPLCTAQPESIGELLKSLPRFSSLRRARTRTHCCAQPLRRAAQADQPGEPPRHSDVRSDARESQVGPSRCAPRRPQSTRHCGAAPQCDQGLAHRRRTQAVATTKPGLSHPRALA